MILPINTDAPIYHWPWVTLVLIVANVLAFVLTGGGYAEDARSWVLEHGTGLHPLEWVVSNFLHFGLAHLVSNMFFLWGFGIIVEGKIGWWRYLLLYFGIGIVRALLEQVMMLGYDGRPSGSGGASGVIFGLMAIALVWAPKNEITCAFIWLFGFIPRVFTFDVTVLTFSTFYLVLSILVAVLTSLLTSFHMTSEIIHLMGGLLGFAVGVVMLRRKWVDCENWDLFAVLAGTHGNTNAEDVRRVRQLFRSRRSDTSDSDGLLVDLKKTAEADGLPRTPALLKSRALKRIRKLLKAGKPKAALAEYDSVRHIFPQWQLKERDLRLLVGGLYQSQSLREVIPLMEEYVERFPAAATRIRLQLAGVILKVQRRPRYALRLVEGLEERLDAELDEYRRLVRQAAERMIAEGVIEVAGPLGS